MERDEILQLVMEFDTASAERKNAILDLLEGDPMVGRKFGKLTVVGRVGEDLACDCACGSKKAFPYSIITKEKHLLSGHTQSCGCSRVRIKKGLIVDGWLVMAQLKGNGEHSLWNIVAPCAHNHAKTSVQISRRVRGLGSRWTCDLCPPPQPAIKSEIGHEIR